MNYEANMLPSAPGVYRWVLDLPVAVHVDVLEASIKSVMPTIEANLRESPFDLGIFYPTQPDAQGNPLPPNPESRQILMGDQFENGFLNNPEQDAMRGYVWWQPGGFAYYRTEDNPSYSKNVFFYIIVKQEIDAPSGPIVFNDEGQIVQTSLSGGFVAAIGAIYGLTKLLALILGVLLVAWGLYKGYQAVKLIFTMVKNGIDDLIRVKDKLGEKFKAWVDTLPKPLQAIINGFTSTVGSITNLLFWGVGIYGGYRLIKWAIEKKSPPKLKAARA